MKILKIFLLRPLRYFRINFHCCSINSSLISFRCSRCNRGLLFTSSNIENTWKIKSDKKINVIKIFELTFSITITCILNRFIDVSNNQIYSNNIIFFTWHDAQQFLIESKCNFHSHIFWYTTELKHIKNTCGGGI